MEGVVSSASNVFQYFQGAFASSADAASPAGGARVSGASRDSFFLEESPAERDRHIGEQLEHFAALLEYERLKDREMPAVRR